MIALLIAVPLVFAFASIPHERLGRYFLPFVAMFNLSLILAIFFAIWLSSRRDNAFISIYLAGLGFFLVTSLILFPGWIPQWFASFIRVHPDLSWVKTPLMDMQPSSLGLIGLWRSACMCSCSYAIGGVVWLTPEWRPADPLESTPNHESHQLTKPYQLSSLSSFGLARIVSILPVY